MYVKLRCFFCSEIPNINAYICTFIHDDIVVQFIFHIPSTYSLPPFLRQAATLLSPLQLCVKLPQTLNSNTSLLKLCTTCARSECNPLKSNLCPYTGSVIEQFCDENTCKNVRNFKNNCL